MQLRVWDLANGECRYRSVLHGESEDGAMNCIDTCEEAHCIVRDVWAALYCC